MSLLGESVAVLNAGLQAVGGETTAYIRGNDSIDNVIGVPVRTRHDEYGDEQLPSTSRERDWIYWQADLELNGDPVTPQRDDVISWIDTLGVRHQFDVLPRGGDRCYRHTDQTALQLRVYTVERLAGVDD